MYTLVKYKQVSVGYPNLRISYLGYFWGASPLTLIFRNNQGIQTNVLSFKSLFSNGVEGNRRKYLVKKVRNSYVKDFFHNNNNLAD